MSGLFLVEKEIEFDAGHRVPDHASKCKNPHGHRYKVIAGVAGELQVAGSSRSMVLDFGEIKRALIERVHDVFDHGFIVYRHDDLMQDFVYLSNRMHWRVLLVDYPPTAEELARAIYEDIGSILPGLAYIKVYETPTSVAQYPWRS